MEEIKTHTTKVSIRIPTEKLQQIDHLKLIKVFKNRSVFINAAVKDYLNQMDEAKIKRLLELGTYWNGGGEEAVYF